MPVLVISIALLFIPPFNHPKGEGFEKTLRKGEKL